MNGMNTKEACNTELKSRIDQAKMYFKSAEDCLKREDFLQCAVRLQEMEKSGNFTEFEMNVFEAESDEEKGARKK